MATPIVKTLKPVDGDYSSLITALADVPASLVATDEQWNIECYTFVGGLFEQVSVPAITQDATRFLEVKVASGNKYDPVTDTGFILKANVAFGDVFLCQRDFTRVTDLAVLNTRTLGSARGYTFSGNNEVIKGLYGRSDGAAGSTVYTFNNASNLDLSESLSCLGDTGFDFGNNNSRTVNKITSVDAASVGIDTGTADTTITNSFSFGSSNPWLGTFNASSSNNASDGTDAPGGSSLQNRTNADFADYASNDFRTAAASALATAGTVD